MQEDNRIPRSRKSRTTIESFEIRVVFVRISSSNIQNNLKLVFSPRDYSQTSLQINGFMIHPSEKICRTLNRHRTDSETSESIYVNTDRIRVNGGILQFELQNQGFVLVSGNLRNMSTSNDCVDNGWLIEFNEGGNSGFNEGFIDIYFAGRSKGKAVLLNGVVELNIWKGLDFISEVDGSKIVARFDNYKELEKRMKESEVDINCELIKHKSSQVCTEDDEEQASWFNEGVRVGMGLGLAVSLGVGVGVGLVMRTYQAATGAFRRYLI